MNLEYILIGINLLIFAVSSYLPNVFYTHFVETYVGAVVLLLISIYSFSYGYLVGVSTFTAAASLYAESHARKAKSVRSGTNPSSTEEKPIDTQLAPAAPIVPNEIHPDMETPPEEKVSFVPKEEDSTNSFNPVGESVNQKTDLPTTSFAKDAEEVYLKDNLAENSLRD